MANIFAQYAQPVRSIQDYQASYDAQDLRREQLGAAQRTNALADLTAEQTRQTMADTQRRQNALRQASLAGKGMTPDKYAETLLSNPDTMDSGVALQKHLADVAKANAAADKDKTEVGETKRKALLQQVAALKSPDDALALIDHGVQAQSLPEPIAAGLRRMIGSDPRWQLNLMLGIGDPSKMVEVLKPHLQQVNNGKVTSFVDTNAYTNPAGPAPITMTTTPGEDSSAATQRRGQDIGASTARRGQDMTDQRQRDKNDIDKSAIGKVEWKQDTDGNWLALPKEVKNGDRVTPIATTAPGKRAVQAGHALDIVAEARDLIDKGTSSYAGAAVDQAARVVGMSTKGSEAGAKLKAIEGALMMAQPRMEGPQSDKDVALYRQMAGQIGDATVPAGNKKAALDAIEQLHAKYADGAARPARAPSGSPPRIADDAGYNALPSGATFVGPDGKTRRKP